MKPTKIPLAWLDSNLPARDKIEGPIIRYDKERGYYYIPLRNTENRERENGQQERYERLFVLWNSYRKQKGKQIRTPVPTELFYCDLTFQQKLTLIILLGWTKTGKIVRQMLAKRLTNNSKGYGVKVEKILDELSQKQLVDYSIIKDRRKVVLFSILESNFSDYMKDVKEKMLTSISHRTKRTPVLSAPDTTTSAPDTTTSAPDTQRFSFRKDPSRVDKSTKSKGACPSDSLAKKTASDVVGQKNLLKSIKSKCNVHNDDLVYNRLESAGVASKFNNLTESEQEAIQDTVVNKGIDRIYINHYTDEIKSWSPDRYLRSSGFILQDEVLVPKEGHFLNEEEMETKKSIVEGLLRDFPDVCVVIKPVSPVSQLESLERQLKTLQERFAAGETYLKSYINRLKYEINSLNGAENEHTPTQ